MEKGFSNFVILHFFKLILIIQKIRIGVRSKNFPASVRQSSSTKSNMSEQQLRLKDEQIKLVRLIERVDSSADRVDNLAKRFDIYDCRMIVIETNI